MMSCLRGPTQAVVEFLQSEGAGELPHAGRATLLDHLLGTYAILDRWHQPDWLARAGLIHSVYGTEAYGRQLLSPSRRAEVRAVAGEQAERIAFLFAVTPRGPLLAGTHRWARSLPTRSLDGAARADADRATRDELDALVLLHMANLAEQATASDGTPGRWLARLGELAELVVDSDSVEAPAFLAHLVGFSEADETDALKAYLAGDFALTAATCGVVSEPCVWEAFAAWRRGDGASARAWATRAGQRLAQLGTAWDRRLDYEEWDALIETLARSTDQAGTGAVSHLTHPRDMLDAVMAPSDAQPDEQPGAQAAQSADVAAGRTRFSRYLDQLALPGGTRSGAVYPDLESRPWHDPQSFALARYLEKNGEAIRAEILGLDAGRFSRESERIGRTGDWDVIFLYERGRRHDDVCAACPVTVHGIERYPAVRTLAGLIYVSRMRPGTHIAAHRGPTNLRVRCHLGIQVPPGDCAIRVGDETRNWVQDRCLVFDDHFEHEAWNHTGEDRIVLIVDLWHPGLSATEVRMLEALHGYTHFHARRLSRYWAANAAARREPEVREPAEGPG